MDRNLDGKIDKKELQVKLYTGGLLNMNEINIYILITCHTLSWSLTKTTPFVIGMDP